MITIYRVQDGEGRGPFRPGFSHKWCDPWEHPYGFQSWIEEFDYKSILASVKPSEHLGCGCRDMETVRQWFSDAERNRLYLFGYRAVRLDADRILAESPAQIVFARRQPLRFGAITADPALAATLDAG